MFAFKKGVIVLSLRKMASLFKLCYDFEATPTTNITAGVKVAVHWCC